MATKNANRHEKEGEMTSLPFRVCSRFSWPSLLDLFGPELGGTAMGWFFGRKKRLTDYASCAG
jgi:hypothetical protein